MDRWKKQRGLPKLSIIFDEVHDMNAEPNELIKGFMAALVIEDNSNKDNTEDKPSYVNFFQFETDESDVTLGKDNVFLMDGQPMKDQYLQEQDILFMEETRSAAGQVHDQRFGLPYASSVLNAAPNKIGNKKKVYQTTM